MRTNNKNKLTKIVKNTYNLINEERFYWTVNI